MAKSEAGGGMTFEKIVTVGELTVWDEVYTIAVALKQNNKKSVPLNSF